MLLVDIFLLWKGDIQLNRDAPPKLSNGDANTIHIHLINNYTIPVLADIIDELPFQLQKRDLLLHAELNPPANTMVSYTITPTKRGEYSFGAVHAYIRTHWPGLAERHICNQQEYNTVPVYPSFLQMRYWQLRMAPSRVHDPGIRQIRQTGHSMEFESIRNYFIGDDYRSINWKATARTGTMMVNHYIDEKSQPVYCVISKSRTMKMPFAGMTLLDYAINSSLILCNTALQKQDKAGLISFSHKIGAFVQADDKPGHINRIMETLYKEKTAFTETDYNQISSSILRVLPRRSLLILFTNFESAAAARNAMPAFRALAKKHLIIPVLFENDEIHTLATQKAQSLQDVYSGTVAMQMLMEKRQIITEFAHNGIQAILTKPQNLTPNVVNKYIEIKAQRIL